MPDDKMTYETDYPTVPAEIEALSMPAEHRQYAQRLSADM